jgi:cytochrome c oxidase cbb3-type subunit III
MRFERIITGLWALALVLLPGACTRTNAPPARGSGDSTLAADSALEAGVFAREDSLTYEQRQGRHLYRKYCMVCHGEEGKGDGFNAYNLDPRPRDFTDARIMGNLTDEKIVQTITGGGRSVNRSPLMPSWGGRLGKEEIRYVLAYIRSFGPGGR